MDRFEKNAILGEVFKEYFGCNYCRHGLFKFAAMKRELVLNAVKWLWKNHRKEYYYLSFKTYDSKTHKSFNDAIHEAWGENGYLPYFSDEPDYYYIYG